MKDRQQTGRQRVKEWRLKHFVAFVWQRQRPAFLDVLNISDVILEIVSGMERQHFHVVPMEDDPCEDADSDQTKEFSARKIDIVFPDPAIGREGQENRENAKYYPVAPNFWERLKDSLAAGEKISRARFLWNGSERAIAPGRTGD